MRLVLINLEMIAGRLGTCCRVGTTLGVLTVVYLTRCLGDDQAVPRAIQRGVDYLIRQQAPDGGWCTMRHQLGETSLAGMALVAGGHPVDSRNVCAAADLVCRLAEGDTSTYDTSLAIMFLDRLGRPADADLLRRLGGRLMDGQCRDGSWAYSLLASSGGGAACRGGDNSNTQFAALSAWISRRHGLANDGSLQRLDEHFRRTFDASAGGWAYVGSGGATPTMTCAGLLGLATNRGAEQQRLTATASESESRTPLARGPGRGAKAADDPIARRALKALGQELQLANRNPADAINSDLYFLWSLERVGVIYDVVEIGGVDWYRWGSLRLLRGQLPDGEWRGVGRKGFQFEQNIGTSFGILFLSRANVAADLTAQVGSGGGVGAPSPGLGGGSPIIRRGGDEEPPPADGTKPVARQPRTQPPNPSVGPGVIDPF